MAEEPRELQKSILRAAREGFAVKGFYGTSMEFITRSAGVSKGAVYWYYPGKWEIYKAVLSEEAERIKRIVIPPGLHLTLADALDFFLIRGEGLIDILAEDRLCRLLFIHLQLEAMRGREEMAEFVASLHGSITEDVIPLLERIFPEDILSSRGITHKNLMNMFISILYGIILNIDLTITRDEAKQNWRFFIQNVIGGITSEA